MYSESDLEAAVAGGALTPQQADAFRNFIAAGRQTPVVDEESFRLLTGFNDIFVGIATAILLVAVAWIGQSLPPQLEGDGPSLFAGLFVAATAWGLAEFFTLKRRMALPSILLLLAFVGGVFASIAVAAATALGEDYVNDNGQAVALVLAFAAAVAAGGAYAHWRRFRVPITIAAGTAALVGLVLALIASTLAGDPDMMTPAQQQTLENVLLGAALVLGIGTFLFAMWWDGADPKRETRRSDVAFWLHLLAAPLIVHPIFTLLGLTEGVVSTLGAVTVILLYVALGLVALAIDRRALLVSALAYVLYALNSLFETYGAVELSVAFTALVIGSALLLLSAFWTGARRAVVKPLPDGLRARLPVLDRTAIAA
ncbi:hypothetical protein RCO27_16195 [Sphingosinicella sp. LHD-64]|uniref:hypothetical protein n=1 Tax=Sphingosinicella sp. LHD-64 TaxID=3072139 RepID=UPI00280DBB34|nr:hypothetical protein [Sphingosinicella sp. LHD-64]MDQ8757768.1 hypothetical protein [Sphingosinicella sp. LHD-64]